MRRILVVVVLLITAIAGSLLLVIAFGGPDEPPPMASINDPFIGVDYSDLPELTRFIARDQTPLAYRKYLPVSAKAKGSVVLIHGSSANSATMHVTARGLSNAGYAVFVPDIRGHGESGTKGQIDYVGQLEDDLEDLVRQIEIDTPLMLVGFSAGGGFALRFAGSDRQALFSGYLLLSPFMGADAPTYRPDSGGWVRVGTLRIVAIALCDAVGLHAFNELPVIRFALNESARAFMTSHYNFALALNFAPNLDYETNIRAVGRPLEVVAGSDDEVFHADRFAGLFDTAGKDVPVTIIPGVGHVTLTLDPRAVENVVAAVNRLTEPGG